MQQAGGVDRSKGNLIAFVFAAVLCGVAKLAQKAWRRRNV
jgi:hypothetical protein